MTDIAYMNDIQEKEKNIGTKESDHLEKDLREDLEVSGLTEVKKKLVKQLSSEFIQDFYDHPSSFEESPDIILHSLLQEALDEQGIDFSENQYSESLFLFLNELSSFVHQISQEKNEKKFVAFRKNFRDGFFFHTPSIFDSVGPVNLFLQQASIERYSDVRNFYGNTLFSLVVEEIHMNSFEFLAILSEQLPYFTLAQKLEISYLLERVVRNGMTPLDDVNESVVVHIQATLSAIRREANLPLVDLATSVADTGIKLSYIEHQGTFGLDEYEKLAESNRLFREKLADEDHELLLSLDLGEGLPPDWHLQYVAKDAVCVLDERDIPQKLARVRWPEIGSSVLIEPSDRDGLIESIKNKKNSHSQFNILSAIKNTIIKKDPRADLRTRLDDLVPMLTDLEKNNLQTILIELERLNHEHEVEYKKLFNYFKEKLDSVIKSHVFRFAEAVQSIEPEEMPSELYDGADGLLLEAQGSRDPIIIIQWAKYFKNYFMNRGGKLSDSTSNVVDAASSLIREAEVVKDEFRQKSNKLNQGREEKLDDLDNLTQARNLFEKLEANSEENNLNFIKYLEALPPELVAPKISASLFSYEDVKGHSELDPFLKVEHFEETLLLQYLHEPLMINYINQELGIDIVELPLRAQIHLLRYLSGQDRSGFNRLRELMKNHAGEKGLLLEAFLACAEDQRNGQLIVELGEKVEPQVLKLVLEKYLEVSGETEKIREYLLEHFPTADLKSAEVQAVVIQLLRKANLILKHFAERSLEDVTASQINSELESIKTEIILFASTFKVGFEKYNLDFSDIKDTSYETRLPETLTEADKVRMEGMFIKNRPLYAKELLKETVEDLQLAMQGEKNSVFYMLEHNKELVAFMRFDPIEPGRVYAGSLNVRDEARGSRLGSAMLQATLEEQGLTADIEAVAYSKNPMLKHYIEDFGFEIVGEIPDYHGTGELFYKLLRKKKQVVSAKN